MTKVFSQAFALLIGVNSTTDPRLRLLVAARDVEALSRVLCDPEQCGYPSEHVRVLTGELASRQEILNGLAWLNTCAENESGATVLIYYSGHGARTDSGRYFLVPRETRLDDLEGTALASEQLVRAWNAIPAARLLVFLDCCHAAGAAEAKDAAAEDASSFRTASVPEDLLEQLHRGEGRAVFASCRAGEKSFVRPDRHLSIFTDHLLEAFKGAANLAGDANVKISHLMGHLSKSVPLSAQSSYRASQTPYFLHATEDFAVALLRGGKGLSAGGWAEVADEAHARTDHRVYSVVQQSHSDESVMVGRDYFRHETHFHPPPIQPLAPEDETATADVRRTVMRYLPILVAVIVVGAPLGLYLLGHAAHARRERILGMEQAVTLRYSFDALVGTGFDCLTSLGRRGVLALLASQGYLRQAAVALLGIAGVCAGLIRYAPGRTGWKLTALILLWSLTAASTLFYARVIDHENVTLGSSVDSLNRQDERSAGSSHDPDAVGSDWTARGHFEAESWLVNEKSANSLKREVVTGLLTWLLLIHALGLVATWRIYGSPGPRGRTWSALLILWLLSGLFALGIVPRAYAYAQWGIRYFRVERLDPGCVVEGWRDPVGEASLAQLINEGRCLAWRVSQGAEPEIILVDLSVCHSEGEGGAGEAAGCRALILMPDGGRMGSCSTVSSVAEVIEHCND